MPAPYRFRSLALLAVALAACASQPSLVAAQPVQGDPPPTAATLPPAVVSTSASTPAFARVSDSTFARLHPAEAREVDSLAAARISPSVVHSLRRIDARLGHRVDSLERRLGDVIADQERLRRNDAHVTATLLDERFTVNEVRVPRAVRHRQLLRGLGLTIASGAAGYGAGALDHDPGGYPDSYRFTTDKAAHAFGSATFGLAVGHLPACLAFGGLYELGQRRRGGYASPQDFAFDAIGCGAGAAWRRLVLHRTR